jgi:hypothetical protein
LVPTDASLRIPDDQLPDLIMLARLEEPKFRALADALAAAPLKLRSHELLPTATGLSKREVYAAVEVLSNLSVVRFMADVDLEEFVDDVMDAMEAQKADFGSDRERLEARLTEALSYPSVTAPAKARSILIDHANYLCRARIFSDIRPVFSSDVDQTPTTAIVTHTLKLSYHQGTGPTKDFFVVLDGNDLDELSRLIERAKAKEKTLHVTLAAAGIEPLRTD